MAFNGARFAWARMNSERLPPAGRLFLIVAIRQVILRKRIQANPCPGRGRDVLHSTVVNQEG